jgi:hypothetical protein
MNEPSTEIRRTWDILTSVAAQTLERKRRLGESAVIWREGRPLITEGDMTAAEGPQSIDPRRREPPDPGQSAQSPSSRTPE